MAFGTYVAHGVEELDQMRSIVVAWQPIGFEDFFSDMEVPLVNCLINSLIAEHASFNEPLMRLAGAASALVHDPSSQVKRAGTAEAWDSLRAELRQHLQREQETVYRWAASHSGVPRAQFETLSAEHEEVQSLAGRLGSLELRGASDEAVADAAVALLRLAQLQDEHMSREEASLFPAIHRALFKARADALAGKAQVKV